MNDLRPISLTLISLWIVAEVYWKPLILLSNKIKKHYESIWKYSSKIKVSQFSYCHYVFMYQSQNHKGCENLPSLHVWWVRRHHVIDLGKIAFWRHKWRHNPLMGTQTEILFSFLTLMLFILYLNTW